MMPTTSPAHAQISRRMHLHEPVVQPEPQHPRCYGVAHYFQVSPTQVLVLVNRRVAQMPVIDHEDGWDMFVVDSLDGLAPQHAQQGMYNFPATHPITGEAQVMIQHVPTGGFVPLGAKLADGRDHPHAGTGFGIDTVVGHPQDHTIAVPLSRGGPPNVYSNLLQFRFDGKKLHTLDIKRLERNQPVLDGWYLGGRGLSPAIPDGEDLLYVMTGGKRDAAVEAYFKKLEQLGNPKRRGNETLGECMGAVLTRWRRGDSGWQIVEIHRISEPGPDMCTEPTLVRDMDGSLLCSVRSVGADAEPGERDEMGLENLYQAFRVYRSTDSGKTWTRHLCVPVVRSASPVTINKLGDGTVYLAANPTLPLETDTKGRIVPMTFQRQRMWMWPLSADRTDVLEPQCLLDAPAEFGPPRPLECHCCDNRWSLDHAQGMPVRFADGKWHNLITFRAIDSATNSGGAAAPPDAGLWVMEIASATTAPKPWTF